MLFGKIDLPDSNDFLIGVREIIFTYKMKLNYRAFAKSRPY